MGVVDFIANAQIDEVLVAGVRWKIRAITSEDLVRHDANLLLGVPVEALKDGGLATLGHLQEKAAAVAKAADQAAKAVEGATPDTLDEAKAAADKAERDAEDALVKLQAWMRRLGPEVIEDTATARRKIVLAGLVAAQHPVTLAWTDLQVIDGDGPHDDERNILNINRLPRQIVDALADAIEALSRGGAWVKALDGLRRSAAGRPGRDRDPETGDDR